MSDINEEQKRLYKRAEENDEKEFLEYEQYCEEQLRKTITNLKYKIERLEVELEEKNRELQDRINKAIDFINSFEIYEPDSIDTTEYKNLDTLGLLNYITNILKGKE
jgi:hypothetical protein